MRVDVGGIKIPLAIVKDKIGEEYYISPEIELTVNLKDLVLMFFPAEQHGNRGTLILKPRRAAVTGMLKDLDRIEHMERRSGERSDDYDDASTRGSNGTG